MKTYLRERFDALADDVAVTRAKVESIEKMMGGIAASSAAQDQRLARLEKKVFAIWFVGPAVLGSIAMLGALREWISGK